MIKSKNFKKNDKLINMLYIIPMCIIFIIFIVIPILKIFNLSVYERKINGTLVFVGLQNFKDFFTNPDTSLMLLNTAIWVFIGTACKILLGIIMALILYRNFFGKKVATAIILIPYAMPAAVSCMIWKLMYNPVFGHINQILRDLNLIDKPLNFLGNMNTSLLAVMLVNIWAVAPFCALNILSSMYSIPTYLYEAAKLDGASYTKQFFQITLPLISSSLRTLTILIGIWAFNAFDVIFMMTQGGPANSSLIMVNDIYQNAFQFNNRGYSAAISVISFALLSIFALLYIKSKNSEVTYE